MLIPAGEIRRLKDEERRREAAHRRIRRDRLRKKLLWLLIGALLGASALIGSHWISLHAASATTVEVFTLDSTGPRS
jgi:hypothetical protein